MKKDKAAEIVQSDVKLTANLPFGILSCYLLHPVSKKIELENSMNLCLFAPEVIFGGCTLKTKKENISSL